MQVVYASSHALSWYSVLFVELQETAASGVDPRATTTNTPLNDIV